MTNYLDFIMKTPRQNLLKIILYIIKVIYLMPIRKKIKTILGASGMKGCYSAYEERCYIENIYFLFD